MTYRLWIVTEDKKTYYQVSARTMQEAIDKGKLKQGRELTKEEIEELC